MEELLVSRERRSAASIPAASWTAAFRSRVTALLGVVVALDIALLVGLRLAATGGTPELAAQVLLIGAFGALAALDLRAAAAIVVLDLIVAGASGQWTVVPPGISGRLVLDGIVFAAAAVGLVRRSGWSGLTRGRYSLHALVLAVVIPGLWIPLGVLNGNALHDAVADGNGYAFLAFALVLAAVSLQGDLAWLRRWVLVACAATALLTAVVAVVVIGGVLPVTSVANALEGRLDMGGAVSYQDGLRVYLGSGLYLQVGMVLVAWELLRNARRLWPWIVLVLLVAALLASYTRGYWVGAIVGTLLVVGLGMASLRRTAILAAAAVILFAAGSVAAGLAGFSLPQYVADRLGSVFVLEFPNDAGGGSPGADSGAISNVVKLRQAQVLLAHIAERPILGWGFGTIAPDYRYGHTYTYELNYIALAYKTGIVGLLLFLSLPLRLLVDAARGWLGRLARPPGVARRELAVPLAVLSSVLLVGATNPYLGAAFGLASLLLCIAWLDPFSSRPNHA
jgi:O-Antigen ligase